MLPCKEDITVTTDNRASKHPKQKAVLPFPVLSGRMIKAGLSLAELFQKSLLSGLCRWNRPASVFVLAVCPRAGSGFPAARGGNTPPVVRGRTSSVDLLVWREGSARGRAKVDGHESFYERRHLCFSVYAQREPLEGEPRDARYPALVSAVVNTRVILASFAAVPSAWGVCWRWSVTRNYPLVAALCLSSPFGRNDRLLLLYLDLILFLGIWWNSLRLAFARVSVGILEYLWLLCSSFLG